MPCQWESFVSGFLRHEERRGEILLRLCASVSFYVALTNARGDRGTFAFPSCAEREHPWGDVDGKTWNTSVWRDRTHGTLLAVPKRIRAGKEEGDVVIVSLEPR